jgi:hypothetical protein
MQNSEHGIDAASSARAKLLSEGHPGWENWQKRSPEMIIDDNESKKSSEPMEKSQGWCSHEIEKEKRRDKKQNKNERTKSKQKKQKQSEAETKSRQA